MAMGGKRIKALAWGAILLVAGSLALLWHTLEEQKLNILLISIDTLRSDHLSGYGYGRRTSPNIDKIANEGVLFTQAIATSSSTISSVPSLMTSLYPDAHKILDFGDALDSDILSLAGILKSNQFYTGMISAQLFPHLLSKGDFMSSRVQLDAKADRMTDWVLEWLANHKRKRFFLWVHYFDPHGPYTPPAEYTSAYLNDRLYVPGIEVPLLKRKRSGVGGIPGYQAQRGIRDKSFYIAQYDGEIRFTDAQIGRLMAFLKEEDLLRETIIVLTSDHGESLGEHNYYFDHGLHLYDSLVRVPLVIYLNSRKPVRPVIRQQVSLVDVMPTILDLAGVKPPREYRPEGSSLVPLIFGRADRTEGYVFSQYFEGHHQKFAIRGGGKKLVYDANAPGASELYDLTNDPEETNNLFSVRRKESESLSKRLDEFLQRGVATKVKRSRMGADIESRERLRSLGYAQ